MTISDTAPVFNLWHARTIDADAVAFDVTRANVPRLAQGDLQWMSTALRALGVDGTPKNWTIIRSRSHYFSDYRRADATWADRWPEAWLVLVRVEEKVPPTSPSLRPVALSELDSTYAYGADDRHTRHATIIAVGAPDAVPPEVERLGGSHTRWSVDDARCQLRVELTLDIPGDLDRLDAVVAALDLSGWATEWRVAT